MSTQTIVVEYDLARPPDKVWRALTEPKLLAQWLMENDIRAEVGHCFTMRAQPVPGWDGVVRCEVLEVEPHKKLSYSWRGGSDKVPGFAPLDTVVTWTLTATAKGTRLKLEHSGFLPANAFAFDNMGKGWRGKIAERIEGVIETLD
jgi:uncharacterized protein YndB with AHSA1/START domain